MAYETPKTRNKRRSKCTKTFKHQYNKSKRSRTTYILTLQCSPDATILVILGIKIKIKKYTMALKSGLGG